jgi:hypothetical protein
MPGRTGSCRRGPGRGEGHTGARLTVAACDDRGRQKTFDNAVKGLVGKDEWKKYQDWRAQRRKEAEDRHHEMMGRGEIGEPPADRVPDAQ